MIVVKCYSSSRNTGIKIEFKVEEFKIEEFKLKPIENKL